VQKLNAEIVTKLGNKVKIFTFIRESAKVGPVVPKPVDDDMIVE
jgi:hypothetical protein